MLWGGLLGNWCPLVTPQKPSATRRQITRRALPKNLQYAPAKEKGTSTWIHSIETVIYDMGQGVY